MDLENFPVQFPRMHSSDRCLRLAVLRAQIAVLAIEEALAESRQRQYHLDLAMKNLAAAVEAVARG